MTKDPRVSLQANQSNLLITLEIGYKGQRGFWGYEGRRFFWNAPVFGLAFWPISGEYKRLTLTSPLYRVLQGKSWGWTKNPKKE
jgi:hypothetical protein